MKAYIKVADCPLWVQGLYPDTQEISLVGATAVHTADGYTSYLDGKSILAGERVNLWNNGMLLQESLYRHSVTAGVHPHHKLKNLILKGKLTRKQKKVLLAAKKKEQHNSSDYLDTRDELITMGLLGKNNEITPLGDSHLKGSK